MKIISLIRRFTNFKLKYFWEPTTILFRHVLTPLQKKPKIMGKDHGMSEVSKHSTSTETMFFEKVSIVIFTTCVCVCVLVTKCSSKGKVCSLWFLLSLKTLPTGEEGSSELWGLWQLPAVSSHFQPGSNFACRAGAVSHPISWVSSIIYHQSYACSQ